MNVILKEDASQRKKYVKTYKCPYCDKRVARDKMATHIANYHEELIPEGYSATRVAFNTVNHKETGHCIICGRETKFNEKKARYERICDRPECKQKYHDMTDARTKKIYGKTGSELIKDIDWEENMLAHRKISGTYNMRGTKFVYTGSYEKKCLEFMDKVLEINPEDLMCPAEPMKYMYKDVNTGEEKELWYIPDMYYIPYNLIIEIKDGGDNKNNRPMKEYRAKQLAKEDAIVKSGKYNYLRLTNNNFGQLLSTMAELKLQLVENNIDERIIRINESDQNIIKSSFDESMFTGISAMMPPAVDKDNVYIVNLYNRNNVFSGYGFSDRWDLEECYVDDFNHYPYTVSRDQLQELATWYSVYRVKDPSISRKYHMFRDYYTSDMPLYEFMMGHPMLSDDQILFEAEPVIDYYEYMTAIRNVIEASLLHYRYNLIHLTENSNPNSLLLMMSDDHGYYYYNKLTGLRTRSYAEKSKINPIEIGVVLKGVVG